MQIGDIIKYRNYGETRTGEIIRFLGKNQLHVTRLDGPMPGSTAWIHRESVLPAPDNESQVETGA